MYETPGTFQAIAWLSMSSFVQQIFAIKFRIRRKTEQM